MLKDQPGIPEPLGARSAHRSASRMVSLSPGKNRCRVRRFGFPGSGSSTRQDRSKLHTRTQSRTQTHAHTSAHTHGHAHTPKPFATADAIRFVQFPFSFATKHGHGGNEHVTLSSTTTGRETHCLSCRVPGGPRTPTSATQCAEAKCPQRFLQFPAAGGPVRPVAGPEPKLQFKRPLCPLSHLPRVFPVTALL